MSFATDADAKIDLSIDAKNTQIKQAGITGAGTPNHSLVTLLFASLGALLAVIVGYYFGGPRSDRNLT